MLFINTVNPLYSHPDIVTSLLISTLTLAQVTSKLIKKTLSLVTSYSIFIITPFFFGPEGCNYKGVDCISILLQIYIATIASK